MDKSNFEEVFNNRYNSRIQWYDKKSIIYKRLTYIFQIPVIIMAAITPIFAA